MITNTVLKFDTDIRHMEYMFPFDLGVIGVKGQDNNDLQHRLPVCKLGRGVACFIEGIIWIHYPFPKRHMLDPTKLKEFADDNFKFDENSRKVSK